MSVVQTEKHNIIVKSEELTGTAEYLTVYTRCRINQSRYIRI